MSIDEAQRLKGCWVTTTDPGNKLSTRVAPHGPYRILRKTKGGKIMLEGYARGVNAASLELVPFEKFVNGELRERWCGEIYSSQKFLSWLTWNAALEVASKCKSIEEIEKLKHNPFVTTS